MGKIMDQRIFPVDVDTLNPATFASSFTTSSGNASGTSTPIAAGPTNLNLSISQLCGQDWLGKSSGFPRDFEDDAKSMYREMFRVYAHVYWAHWIDPFWHCKATDYLNTCFIHFISVARLFGLLSDSEMEPLKPLIEVWVRNGSLPPTSEVESGNMI